jgi:hypothetical protein
MERISIDLGQFVVTGEPVAVMGGGAQLPKRAVQTNPYFKEFRKDGVPVDPGPWWARRPEGSRMIARFNALSSGTLSPAFRKKAHRRPDERVQLSQANSGCMPSGARRVHPVIVGWSTANRPLIAQAHQ